MCTDEIGRVVALDRVSGAATVRFGGSDQLGSENVGSEKDVSLLALEREVDVGPGDWLVVYQGYALHVIDEPTARELLHAREDAALATVPESRAHGRNHDDDDI